MSSSSGSDTKNSIEYFSLDGSGELPPLPLMDSGLPMQSMDFQSSEPLPESFADASAKPQSRGKGKIWLDGDVVFCGCPDCGAPVAIRVWLMMADCWQCTACIQLTEEQERQVQQLLRQRESQKTAPTQPKAKPEQRSLPVARSVPAPTPQTAPIIPAPHTPTRQTADVARLRRRMKRKASDAWITEFFQGIPAFVISFILHVILGILLALIPAEKKQEETMTLSLTVGQPSEGERKTDVDPLAELAFDIPVPDHVDPNAEEVKLAREDAQDLLVDPGTDDPALPDLNQVRELAKSNNPRRLIAGRDPRLRVEVLKREGGTVRTEAAVARGLRWIAKQQQADGSWRLTGYPSPGAVRSPAAATSLALLPFLGAGQTHQTGKYKTEVSKGLRWLIEHQARDGNLAYRASGDSLMYSHGQATIVMCEAFSMTGDERLRQPAQKAIDYIVKAQHRGGGWRYRPGMAGDTSVLGWQLMALHSGRVALLNVPQEAFDLADQFLDSVQYFDGALYAYNPARKNQYLSQMKRSRDGTTPIAETMTAEALLCRMYLGWDKGRPELGKGLDILTKHFPAKDNYNIYYVYYATQAFRHYGGNRWRMWNHQMRELLIDKQESRGKLAGSWTPTAYFDKRGGRLFMTSMAVCCLEVYYRYLPVFQPE